MRAAEDKEIRQSALRDLLDSRHLSNQSEVVEVMNEMGYAVTQPSISRDFRELGVVKIEGRYALGVSTSTHVDTLPRSLVKSVESVGENMLVVKTDPGAAGMIAAALDAVVPEGLAGSIAGDDTIFLAIYSADFQESLTHLVWSKARG